MDYAIELNGTVYAETNDLPHAIEVASESTGTVVVSEATNDIVWSSSDAASTDGSTDTSGQAANTGGSGMTASSKPGGSTSTGTDNSPSTANDNSSPPTNGSGGGTDSSQGSSQPTLPSVYYSLKNSLVYKTLTGGYTYVIGPAPMFMASGAIYTAKGTQFYRVNADGTLTYAGTYESPYRTLDLTLSSPVSAARMAAFIQANDSNSPLLPLVPVYFQAQQTYGVNAAYLLAHSVIESAWGTSQIAHDKNNLFGYSAFDSNPYASASTFPSMAYAILYEAWYVRQNYLSASGQYFNGPNLDGMNVDYATDPNWAESISAVMWALQAYRAADYVNQNPLPSSTTGPVFSYAPGVVGAITGTGVNIRAQPSLQASVYEQMNLGTAINITGWLPGWYQVLLPDKRVAYVSNKYAKPTNLGKVTGNSVQARMGPSLNTPGVRTTSYGDLVEILGVSPDGQWTQVKLMDGTQGYIFSQYVANLT